ncbi:hypothetical protein [Rhizobium sp. AG855]|uniref:hypothetical protein n=1 Tax=Rhizobium sp. AG855 TaxID=2183898 RepID=UPI0011C39225|nr:hypothetical protein [Rhizobium sp. AG855]
MAGYKFVAGVGAFDGKTHLMDAAQADAVASFQLEENKVFLAALQTLEPNLEYLEVVSAGHPLNLKVRTRDKCFDYVRKMDGQGVSLDVEYAKYVALSCAPDTGCGSGF